MKKFKQLFLKTPKFDLSKIPHIKYNQPFQKYDESDEDFKKRLIQWYKENNLKLPKFIII